MKSITRSRLPLAATLGLVAILVITSVLFTAPPATAQEEPTGPPARPTGLTGNVAHDQVNLSWDDPGDANITGYQILRRNKAVDDPGVFHVHVENTGNASTSYADSDIQAKTRYVYRIKARNAAGLSPQSSYFNADTPAAPPPPEPESQDPPAQPTGLTSAVTHNKVTLSWDDPGDDAITGYRILRLNRAEDNLGEFHIHVSNTGSAATSYLDSDVEPETRYVYRIRALNSQGESPRSGYTNADTPAAPVPAAPANLLTAATHNQVLLNWDDPDDDSITGYRILRGLDPGSLAVIEDNTGSPAATYTDEDVEPDTAYVYAVRALNASRAGEPSESVGATTQPAPEEQNTARQTSGVCDRTDAVENAIVAAVSVVTACGDVTTMHLGEILSLDLSNKGIASLQSGDFDGLTALTTLTLDNNDLESLPEGVFDGLTALTTLTLDNNDLESLPAGVFDGLTALTTLDLYSNFLESLPADVFDGLTALEFLSLYSNDLESLPAGVFDGLTALTTLDLYSNDLESLPAGIFDELTALERLSLNDNPGSADFIPTANAGNDQVVGLETGPESPDLEVELRQ